MTDTLHVMIGICTFRRPEIVSTLASLSRLQLPAGVTMSACVADNDTGPSARDRVTRAAQGLPFPVTYLHAPERNISVARNAILDQAALSNSSRLTFIDDDETVDPHWLAALLARQSDSGCAAVVGPVMAAYGADAPDWMQRGQVHDTRPDVDAKGMAHTGYTCNLLLDLQDRRFAGRRFDLVRGRSGGEDTAFFAPYLRAGGQIAFAPEAIVRETVPADRATLRWLLRRRFRMGQTHGQLVSQRRSGPGRILQAGLAAAKCAYCIGVTVVNIADPLRRNRALMRGTLHAGAVTGALGAQPVQIYGETQTVPEKTT